MATEKRLIDVCAEIRKIEEVLAERKEQAGSLTYRVFEAVKTALEKAPTIDAVPVVRCKDCIYWKKGDSKGGNSIEDLQVIGGCKWAKCCRREMDFCSMGERKDNDL